MSSSLDKDFNGTATLVEVSDTVFIYNKDNAIHHFNKVSDSDLVYDVDNVKADNTVPRLEFTEPEFFNENGDY